MNQVSIVGRLVYEPELKQSQNGDSMISTRVAVDRHDQNRSADFFTVRIYGKAAEFVSKYFHKGSPISINGKLRTSQYTKQDGTKVDEVYIFGTEIEFVPRTQDSDGTQEKSREVPAEPAEPVKADLPFEI